MKKSGTPLTPAGLAGLLEAHRLTMFEQELLFGQNFELYRKFRDYWEVKRRPIIDNLIEEARKKASNEPSEENTAALRSLEREKEFLTDLFDKHLGWPTIRNLETIVGERPPLAELQEFFNDSKPARLAKLGLMVRREREGVASLLASHTANDRRWSPWISRLPNWIPYLERAHRWGCYKMYFQELDRAFPYSREPMTVSGQFELLEGAEAKFGEPMLQAYFRLKVTRPYRDQVVKLAEETNPRLAEALKKARDSVKSWPELTRSPEHSNSNTALVSMLAVGIGLSIGTWYFKDQLFGGPDDKEPLSPDQIEAKQDELIAAFEEQLAKAKAGDEEANRWVSDFAKYARSVEEGTNPETMADDLEQLRNLVDGAVSQ